jgi:choline monooxygenase
MTVFARTAMTELDHDLRATLEANRGLPGRFFTDENVFALERQRLLAGTWWCVGLSADVADRGDLRGVTAFGLPLLLVRDRDSGALRVFHNVCSHRGAVLVEGALGGQVRIVCPYHSWTYSLRGELLRTPHVAGAEKHDHECLDRVKLSLREVPSREWAGHIFVDLHGSAAPFEEWIAPVARRLGKTDWSQLRRDTALSRQLDVGANWKIVVENFVESYHLPWVHRKLNAVNPMRDHYQILGGHSYIGQGSVAYEGVRDPDTELPLFAGTDRSRYEALYIFPNLILSPLADLCFSILLEPQSAQRTHERVEFFFAGDEAMTPGYSRARETQASFITEVNAEDIRIVEKVQRGRLSPAFVGGQFSPGQEETSLHLQKLIAARMLASSGKGAADLIELPEHDIIHDTRST